jgi:hypothetical protein
MLNKNRCLGVAAAIAVLAIALGGAGSVVRADDGGSVSGRIVHDIDGDGDPTDANEPGLSNWRVELRAETDEGESEPVETRTDAHGDFTFFGLAPGDYQVSIPCDGQPHLWMATWPDSSTYLGVIVEQGYTPEPLNYLLKTLNEPPEANGSVSGRLTWDTNRNAAFDVGEPGAVGWTLSVSMIDAPQCFSVEEQQVTTEADGGFTVSGLLAGTWSVGMAQAPTGTNRSYTLDYPGFSEQHAAYEAFYPEALVDVPEHGTGEVAIGILDVSGTASISGRFFWDKNGDGVKQANEPAVVCACFFGIMVRTPNGFASFFNASSLNMDSGPFKFSGLAAGEYMILGSTSRPRFVTVADGEQVAGIDFAVSFAPGETPTTVPESGPTPQPQPTAPASPVAVGPPDTGSGGATGEPSASAILAFGTMLSAGGLLIGLGALRSRR